MSPCKCDWGHMEAVITVTAWDLKQRQSQKTVQSMKERRGFFHYVNLVWLSRDVIFPQNKSPLLSKRTLWQCRFWLCLAASGTISTAGRQTVDSVKGSMYHGSYCPKQQSFRTLKLYICSFCGTGTITCCTESKTIWGGILQGKSFSYCLQMRLQKELNHCFTGEVLMILSTGLCLLIP